MRGWLFWIGLLLCLGIPNLLVARKQHSLLGGRVVYLPLAPVDPRSLMQGDYMQLRYALPTPQPDWPASGLLAADVDTRGVLSDLRRGDGPVHVGYKLKNGKLWVATDAFYFEEGSASRYQQAAYGKFHLSDTGSLTLQGLASAELKDL